MKARLIPTKKLESKRKTILELFNDLTWSKNQNTPALKGWNFAEAATKATSKNGIGLGVALLTGGAVQQFLQSKRDETSPVFPVNTTFQDTTLEKAVALEETNHALAHNQISGQTLNTIVPSSTISTEVYLPTSKLTARGYGLRSDRMTAIYRKIRSNKRLIQREDLLHIDSITKGQNSVGIAFAMSGLTTAFSACSKTLSRGVATKVWKLGMVAFLASCVGMSHYSYKFSKFMDYTNDKYFYATSLKDLQDPTLFKSNLPKSEHFEGSNWSLKSKLPTSMSWLVGE
jgi:hypothetical protein